jgi:hypothetical protein
MKLQEVNIKELEGRFEMATIAENPSLEKDMYNALGGNI